MTGRRLNKLRKMPAAEIKGRARIELLKLRERVSTAAGREMSDREFLRHFPDCMGLSCPEQAARLILDRLYQGTQPEAQPASSSALFPSLSQRREVVEVMKRRFPEERAAIIRKADNACRGTFDVLGFAGLSFGDPIDWRLEPISGRRTPLVHWSRIDYLNAEVAGDKKITWELNRHQHFVTLGQAYWMTGDERYAAAFAGQLDSWMSANPPGMGINWASSLELAIRLVSWIWSLYLFSGSQHLAPKFVARLLKFVLAQAHHIDSFTSVYFSPNTHLTGEALGLLYCAAAVPEFELASYWRDRGTGILVDQLPAQVLPDGVYFERSTYYHRYCADFYTHLLLLSRRNAVPLGAEVNESLTAMLDHLMWVTRPGGSSPLIGDDDGGRLIMLGATDFPGMEPDREESRTNAHAAGESRSPRRQANDFRDTLCTGAAIFGRADWKHVAGDAAVETLWLLGPKGLKDYDAIQAVQPARTDNGFEQGGVYVMRDGWVQDSTVVIVNSRHQPLDSAAHAHADAMSFELAAAGKQWLVDPGTFTYTGSASARQEFRSALWHNVAVVDGTCPSEPAGPFSWKRLCGRTATRFSSSPALSYFRGSHDGYMHLADPVAYARQFALIRSSSPYGMDGRPSYLVISDEFLSNEPHSYELSFIFDPSCSVTADGARVVATHPDGFQLDMFAGGTIGVDANLRGTSVSRCYGESRRAPAVSFRSTEIGLQQLVSVMVPSRMGVERTVKVKDDRAGRWIEITVDSTDWSDQILIANSLREPGTGCDRLNGATALTRRRRGLLELAALVDGDRLEAGELSIFSSGVLDHCEVALAGGRAEVRAQSRGRLDLEIRIGPVCLRIDAPDIGASQFVSRTLELPRAAVHGTGK